MFFLVYETKNMSLEEVNELYETVGKAWQSKKFRAVVKRSNSVAQGGIGRNGQMKVDGELDEKLEG